MSESTTIRLAVADVRDTVEEFKDFHAKQIDAVVKQVNDVEKRVQRMALGGVVSHAGAEDSEAKAAVNAALREFAKSGDAAAFHKKAMSVGSDPDGGYLVTPYLSSTIAERLRELSPVRQYARVVPLPSGDSFEEPREDGEAAATWAGETEARPDTDGPTLRLARVPLHEIYAMPKLTQKLIDTSGFDIAGWVAERIAERFARAEGAAFVAGDGVLKPRGFTTYPTAATSDATRAWGTFEHVATGSAGAFRTRSGDVNPVDDLHDLMGRLKTGYLSNARWFMSRATAAAVRKLKDGQGNFIWQPSAAAGQPPTLLGHPVVMMDDMPAIGTDSLSIAFGDLAAAYTVVERPGLRLLADPYTSKPHVRMYAYQRVGGDAVDFEAIKFLKFGTS